MRRFRSLSGATAALLLASACAGSAGALAAGAPNYQVTPKQLNHVTEHEAFQVGQAFACVTEPVGIDPGRVFVTTAHGATVARTVLAHERTGADYIVRRIPKRFSAAAIHRVWLGVQGALGAKFANIVVGATGPDTCPVVDVQTTADSKQTITAAHQLQQRYGADRVVLDVLPAGSALPV